MTSIIDTAWEEFKRQWAVDGMPADKQRLARAAYECGQSSNRAEDQDCPIHSTGDTHDSGEGQKPTPAQAYYMMPCAQLLAQAQDAGTERRNNAIRDVIKGEDEQQ